METKSKTRKPEPLKWALGKQWVPSPTHFTVVKGKSMTVPGQAMDVKKLMDRIAAGMPISDVQRIGSFMDQKSISFDSPDLEKVLQADHTEKALAYENAEAVLQEFSKQQRLKNDRTKEQLREEEIKKAIEDDRAKRRAKSPGGDSSKK